MRELPVALIGGGNIAKTHVAAAKESGGRVRVVAVVDPSETAVETIVRDTGAVRFASTEALLASSVASSLRGAIVATPPNARIPIVAALLEHGIATLVEKPLAHTLADARELNELAGRHPNTVAAVGYCHRFTPAITEMKRLIDAAEIGDVSRFENTFAAPLPAMATHWMSDPAISGGGSFIDTGCHGVDLFLHLIGQGQICSATFHHAWPGRGESSATVHLRKLMDQEARGASAGARPVAGVIQSGWLEPARFVVTVVGTEGSLHYDYDRPAELLHRRNDGEDRAVAVDDPGLRFTLQLQAFADAVDKGAGPQLASFAEALVAAALIDAAQRAAHNE